MSINELFIQIKEPWLERVSRRLAKEEGVREFFKEELDRFYDLLHQSVETGDSGWMETLLIEWTQALTETELENDETSSSTIISQIFLETINVIRDHIPVEQAIRLVESVIPIFTFTYERIASLETVVRVGYISSRLEGVQYDLEHLDRSKSDFISVAAHELKTPLTLIEGYASMLRENVPDEEQSSQALFLKGIDNGIQRLGQIVNDMVDVSMIDNDMLALNFQPTWINQLLDVIQNDMSEPVQERNQNLIVHRFPGCDEMTFADSARLYQALWNVLSNAIKYTPDNGNIIVDGRKLAGFLDITIKDGGIGIDPDDHDRIFEKFGRVGSVSLHSSGKTKYKGGGPGLGLPIAKGILEAHGGTIWVESEGCDENRMPGSVFHILLPLRDEPPDDKLAKLFQPLTEDSQKKIDG
jgi:signal transduction histidine kinase